MTPSLTSEGHVLLLRALDGEALKFTRIQLGNGVAQNAKNATSLSNPLISMLLTKMTTGSQYITLTSSFPTARLQPASGSRKLASGPRIQTMKDPKSYMPWAMSRKAQRTIYRARTAAFWSWSTAS